MVSRRDFINGVGVVVGSSFLPPGLATAVAANEMSGYYPPILTGMRGSHDGAYEVAHALRDGVLFGTPEEVEDVYDLIVVGGGISGLASAYFYRKQVNPDCAHPDYRQSR